MRRAVAQVRKRAVCIAAALALGAGLPPVRLVAQAPAPIHLTMQDAVRRAVERGEEVGLAQVAVSQAHSQVITARADALPQIRATLNYQRTIFSPFTGGSSSGPVLPPFAPDTTLTVNDRLRYLENEYPNMLDRQIGKLFSSTPFGRPNTYTTSLQLTQTLFQAGKVGAALQGAHAFESAARSQLEETRQDITYRTRAAYLNALYAERLAAIAASGRDLSAEQLRRVELSHRVGNSADYDLLRAQVETANQEPLVVQSRNDRDIALLQLRQLVNIPVDVPIELDASVIAASNGLPEVDFDALRSDVEARAAIAAAQSNVEFRRQAVRFFHGDYFPALKLTVNIGAQQYPSGFAPNGTWAKDWNATLGLSWQLFDGFRTRGQIESARAELSRAELQLAQTRESASLDVERARADVARARALVDARQQTVTQATRAQHLASVRYANGIATPLEVSDARLAMQQSQVNEAQATRDYLLSLAALERALGRPAPLKSVQQRAEGPGSGVRGQGSGENR
jgi:outer membrane protein TolC